LCFSSRRRHTRSKRDWSSDVCSSDGLFVLSPSRCALYRYAFLLCKCRSCSIRSRSVKNNACCRGRYDTAREYRAGCFTYTKKNIWCEKRQSLLRSEEHTSELQSRFDLVCRLLLEKK